MKTSELKPGPNLKNLRFRTERTASGFRGFASCLYYAYHYRGIASGPTRSAARWRSKKALCLNILHGIGT